MKTILKQLIRSFGEIAKISKDGEEEFLNVAARREFCKNEILTREGYSCHQIHFIERGIARTFYYKDNKDVTYWIAAEGEFIGSMASFFSKTPGNKYVETMEDCILWVFDRGIYNRPDFSHRLSFSRRRFHPRFSQSYCAADFAVGIVHVLRKTEG